MQYFSNELQPPSFQVYIFIIIGTTFFVLGVLFPKILLKISKTFENKIKILENIKNEKLKNIPLFDTYNIIELILVAIVTLGIILQIANLLILGGIPLFSGILKENATTKIWLFSYIFFLIGINLLLGKFKRKSHYILLTIGILLFTLTGYRTTPITILLSVFITLYYTRKFKMKHKLFFAILIVTLLIAIGFIATKSIEWQQWRLNPLELVSYRVGFTLNMLDKAIYLQGSTNGSLFYYTLTGFFKSLDPRVLVGEAVIGKNHSITSTIFGPAILDFGLLAMTLQMFIIGFILKLLHLLQKHFKGILTGLYAIILAQTIVWIETGPTDIVVWIFYLIGIFTMIYYFYYLRSVDNI
jgi:oligosaccharide repeat unit polymerase